MFSEDPLSPMDLSPDRPIPESPTIPPPTIPSPTIPPPTAVHWFRLHCLRLHDNPSFADAVTSGQRFKALFIIDPWFTAKFTRGGGPQVNVWRFLLESLKDLDSRLQKKPYRTRLNVLVGQPTTLLPSLFKRWNVTKLTYQTSLQSSESVNHDQIFKVIAQQNDVEVSSFISHTLFNPADLIALNDGKVPLTYKEFCRLIPKIGKPKEPVPEPDPTVITSADSSETIEEPEGKFPTLQDLGFEEEEELYTNSWIGGESEALSQIHNYCNRRSRIPEEAFISLTSKDALSPYIRFGCLSVRLLYSEVKQFASTSSRGQALFKKICNNLLMREFAFVIGSNSPKFDVMVGNPLCIQVPWDKDEVLLKIFREGRTGYPWIDAAVRQIRKEGWAHFIVRDSLGVFLTRGYLWLSWEHGLRFFQEFMLDFEIPVSALCWMQSSCSAYFSKRVEMCDPCLFGRKLDEDGHYVKKYVPELRNLPTEYVHEPWKAPTHIQEEAGCVMGRDYPYPVIREHSKRCNLCCKRLKWLMKALKEVH